MNLNINFEDIKTIAAFSGFLALLIQIYDKFIAKPKLDIDITYSGLIYRGSEIDFKVDLDITALIGDVSIKNVYIFNALKEEYCFIKKRFWYRDLQVDSIRYHPERTENWHLISSNGSIQKIPLDKAIKGQSLYYTGDISQLRGGQINDKFIVPWRNLSQDNYEEKIRGFKVTKHSRHLFTFAGILEVPEEASKDDLPTQNWYICFDYGIGKVEKRIFEGSIAILK
ncbi:hypothetical protein VB774_02685 [Pseudanabaena galeata UHCC 0370]|uniref:DUF3108 domain-containing protein n=1 Tax=Pseudanabaena galeata UHCC 0370 TaxID=3110310 RepID=A0ABU5TE22_9CYAN|nr:hypothetical protein [Pseudanabaena galeata]MEA5476516.1 hypothetical protein [Pseudanabaena galeata UHCC 0370]